ncbi:unnamed protein product, partial [Allacma fusca]
LPHCQCLNIALQDDSVASTINIQTLQNQLDLLSIFYISSSQYSHQLQISILKYTSVKTQAFVQSALKSRQVQKVYDIPNTLKDNQSSLIKMESSLHIDFQHEPVTVLVCATCVPAEGHRKIPPPLIFTFIEFISFINATPDYKKVFADINSADWKIPLIDGTAAISMPLILDDGEYNFHATSLNFYLGIIFITALPKVQHFEPNCYWNMATRANRLGIRVQNKAAGNGCSPTLRIPSVNLRGAG